jgi:N-formylglutamate amidohydrolase
VTNSFLIRTGDDAPVAAAAIHDGHAVRADVRAALALGDEERLREEDPFTAQWAEVVETRLIGLRSRFEVDLNRPRARAVYQQPEDAWGLHVWRDTPPPSMVTASLAQYDAFYAAAEQTLARMHKRWRRFVVLDLHSYNHRRDGPTASPSDPETHPEVNIGTSNMDRRRWAPVVDGAIAHLRTVDFMGRRLDVRENVMFRGGHFPQWIHNTFPSHACAIAIEFRKSFMDEWTGIPDTTHVQAIRQVLASLVPEVERALKGVGD